MTPISFIVISLTIAILVLGGLLWAGYTMATRSRNNKSAKDYYHIFDEAVKDKEAR